MVFIDLADAYDSVPYEMIWKTFEARQVPMTYVRAIHNKYCPYTTCVGTAISDTQAFDEEMMLHHGLALSPYIFALIMDEIYYATREGVPLCMLLQTKQYKWSSLDQS